MKELISLNLRQHVEGLAKKEYSAEELTRAYLQRIEDTASINSFVTLNAEGAIKSAKEADVRRLSGRPLSAIDGIPYGAKDNICTKGIRTTCSSKMLENYIPPYDATVIERLSAAGAVLIGKTNLDEFAMGVSTESSMFGTTLNPLDLQRVAGGSSGGSAAAVAARQVPFTLGTDTGGSIRQPAAFCGVVGMRSTYGSVSRYGIVSFSPSMDIAGAVTYNVADNALITSYLCGKDVKDETSFSLKGDICAQIGSDIKGMKIALISDIPDGAVSPEVKRAMDLSVERLRELGATVESISLRHAMSAYAVYCAISCAEASSTLARFDGVRYGFRAKGYEDLDSLYRRSRSEGIGKEVKRRILFGTMVLSSEYKSDLYENACNMRALIGHELCEALSRFDAILLPTAPTAAYEVGYSSMLSFEACSDDIFCALAALAGLPAISLPISENGSLPVGVQLMGAQCSEAKLYRIAAALEKGGEI